MSFVGSMFSGAKGTGFQAQGANIQQPATVEQANQLYQQAQSGLSQQQALINALSAQGGIQNQTDVYNALTALSQGQGPSLARTQLQQATGANVANQAALMAGQRGSSANVGLMARQAAQQGAATQQNAVGQMAQLRAQEQLGALQQRGQLATQQVGQQTGAVGAYNQFAQGEQQNILNAIAQSNAAQVNMQSNLNQTMGNIAGINAQGQQAMVGGFLSSLGSAGGLLGGTGGGGGGGMGAMGAMAAEGGMVPNKRMYADGGFGTDVEATNRMLGTDPDAPISSVTQEGSPNIVQSKAGTPMLDASQVPTSSSSGPISSVGKFLSNVFSGNKPGNEQPNQLNQSNTQSQFTSTYSNPGAQVMGKAGASFPNAAKKMAMFVADGGMIPAKVSPGEVYLPPKDVKKVAKGEKSPLDGEKIPGKPKYPGNNYANDVVDKNLAPGGIVIPNSVIQSKDPHKEAAKFVAAVLAKQGIKKAK